MVGKGSPRSAYRVAPAVVERRRRFPTEQAWPFALILCATFVAYLPALNGALVWDDAAHVTRPELRSLHGLWRIWFNLGATQQYYPLLHSAFWVEYKLWGDAVLGYHLVNVALHAVAACLAVQIGKRLSLAGAWLAGLLFAVHPLCVESVAWISEQKSVLSAAFCLAAALVYLDFDESRRRSRYFVAFGLFLLALLSKSVIATLPAALLVVLWWRRGRIEWKRDALPLVPWFVLGASAGLFTAWVERTYIIGAEGAGFTLTLLQRVLLAGRALWFYAAKVTWPANLTFFYPRWTLDPAQVWQYLFVAAAAVALFSLWRLSPRNRGPLAASLIFAILLFPALGFFNVYPFRYSFVADHFAYLASLAIIVPAAAMLAKFKPALLIVPALGLLAFQQSGIYKDEETLYRATLARNPDAWLAHDNLANILLSSGRQSEAIDHLQTALLLEPDFWEAHLTLGNALIGSPGRLNDALAEYQTAARLEPGSERTQTNLGNALLQAGRVDEAIAQLEIALRIDPRNPEAHNDLGNAYSQMHGRLADAIAEYRAALASDPNFAEAHNNLGRALAQSGRLPDAIAELQAAIRIEPNYWSAHNNLGNALSRLPGRLDDAVAEYETAIRLRPDSPAAHNNLGFALSHIAGRMNDAIAEYRSAIALDPSFAPAQQNLAAATSAPAR